MSQLLRAIVLLSCMGASIGEPLSPTQWRTDLEALREAIVSTHPDPFHAISEADFDAALMQLSSDLERLAEAQIIVRMAALVALLQDGHTRLALPADHLDHAHTETQAARVEPFGQIPLRFRHAADSYVVVQAAREHRALLGAELAGIGTLTVDQIEQRLFPVAHGDNPGQRRSHVAALLGVPDVLWALGIAEGEADWRFRKLNGESVRVAIAARPPSASPDWVSVPERRQRPATARGERLWLQPDLDGLVYVRVAEITNEPDYSIAALSADTSAALERSDNPGLVLDLRGNTGGSNDFVDPLVRLAVREKELWAPGRLFVLTDAQTFSAAVNLASELERWTPAIFVGAPTGGAPNHYGDARKTVLPESGLTVRISTLLWQDGGPFDHRDAISPLVPAPATAGSLANGTDPAIAAVQALQVSPEPQEGLLTGTIAFGSRMLPMGMQLSGDAISFTITDIGVTDADLQDVKRTPDLIFGQTRLGSYPIALHARFAGKRLVGWMDVAGKPYPFLLDPGTSTR